MEFQQDGDICRLKIHSLQIFMFPISDIILQKSYPVSQQ